MIEDPRQLEASFSEVLFFRDQGKAFFVDNTFLICVCHQEMPTGFIFFQEEGENKGRYFTLTPGMTKTIHVVPGYEIQSETTSDVSFITVKPKNGRAPFLEQFDLENKQDVNKIAQIFRQKSLQDQNQ